MTINLVKINKFNLKCKLLFKKFFLLLLNQSMNVRTIAVNNIIQ